MRPRSFARVDEPRVQCLRRESILRGHFQNAGGGAGGAGDSGAAVAVGLREIAHRRAADEVVLEAPVCDELDGLCGDTFIVDVIGADEVLAREGFQGGIVNDIEESGSMRAWKLDAKGPLVRASVPSLGRVAATPAASSERSVSAPASELSRTGP